MTYHMLVLNSTCLRLDEFPKSNYTGRVTLKFHDTIVINLVLKFYIG